MKKILIALSGIAFLIGALWYALHHKMIIINLSGFTEYSVEKPSRRKVPIVWFNDGLHTQTENTEVLWTSFPSENTASVITAWLQMLPRGSHYR